MLFCNKYFKCRFGWNYCNASPLVPGAIECKAISQMEGPPLQTMERSRPVVNQRSRICLCFSTGRRFSNLGSGQIDSSCLSPSDTGLHGCRDPERGRGPLCLRFPRQHGRRRQHRQLTSGTSDEEGRDLPAEQMSQLHIQDTTPPIPCTAETSQAV